MELLTDHLSRTDYIRAFEILVAILRSANVADVLVSYGFGCDCPDEQLYQEQRLPLTELLPFMVTSEEQDYYRIGKDNLHVWDSARTTEILLGHEADILVVSEDAALLEQLEGQWRTAGFLGVHRR